MVKRGQASLEMSVAMIGALLLLVACIKVYVWINGRLLNRQQAYEASRVAAGRAAPGQGVAWNEPSEKLSASQ